MLIAIYVASKEIEPIYGNVYFCSVFLSISLTFAGSALRLRSGRIT